MHDIICPHCGESFIASDVAFDVSEYILSNLYSDPKDSEDVKSVGFKFFVDEEMIRKHGQPKNTAPLECETPGGPAPNAQWYPFEISNATILQYIKDQVTIDGNLNDLLEEIAKVQGTRGAHYTVRHVDVMRILYHRYFAIAKDSYADHFDIDDANVQIALKILLYVYKHPTETVTLRVSLYSAKLNPQKPSLRVPDILFVLRNGFKVDRHYKCCRDCGFTFPNEYGYFKMMPVVLMGSHYAGKTSYLLSLLYTVRELPPFAFDGIGAISYNVATLNEDKDLVAFNKNIDRFRKGEDPDKTDFTNVPILNLLVNNIIYTFIDWPGEKFIDEELTGNDDFVFGSRRIIFKARHFLCFLEPCQIDLNRIESEEHVRYSAAELKNRFEWHMSLPDPKRLRSITYIANKIDLYMGDDRNEPNPNASVIMDLARNKRETSVYTGGKWNQAEFEAIANTTLNFIQDQNPSLLAALNSMPRLIKVPKVFLPVAPYGERRETNGKNVVHHTRLAGIPFLRILEIDKSLMKRATE